MANLPTSRYFPPAEIAGPDGLLAIGGRLAPQWLLDAYGHGIFPWPQSDLDDVIPWCSPDPRAVIEFDRFHVPRRLARTCRGGRFEVTFDRDFAGVIRGCATAEGRVGATWLTARMIRAYSRMFELGHVHSVETWHEGQLAGGLYGVAIGGLFAAETMFHRVRDASKVALVHLIAHLKAQGYRLVDIQQLTSATAQFGVIEIPRSEYLARLAEAVTAPVTFGPKPTEPD
jgi:leucyl/phenylalanyl-tRNA---protein transferase